MQREEDNRRSEIASYNVSPEKSQKTPRDDGKLHRFIFRVMINNVIIIL